MTEVEKKLDDLNEMFGAEPLDPELEPYLNIVDGHPMLRHPLVYSILHAPLMNKMVNRQLKAKRKYVAEHKAKGEYSSAIWMYERPYRIEAFVEMAPLMTDEMYWETLGSIWTDSENIWQNLDSWKLLLSMPRPHRECMMDEGAEREKYDDIRKAEMVRVYRGAGRRNKYGLSWTLDKSKALFFANRFRGLSGREQQSVWQMDIPGEAVTAYFSGRGESEVVLVPEWKSKFGIAPKVSP